MRQGSAVHKVLEDQVHTNVPVEVMTKEDGWALRIWNVIQGLRMLRMTGMTRELEVWGVIDGEIVNGIIDQLSYDCPDPELDASAETCYANVKTSASLLPEYQTSITEYFLSPTGSGRKLSDIAVTAPATAGGSTCQSPASNRRIYITDIKSRGTSSRSVPSISSSGFRPTYLQLQLYYHLLTRLVATEDVTISTIAARYDLHPDQPFSDAFIAQVGSLNDQFFSANSSLESELGDVLPSGAEQQPPIVSDWPPSQDSMTILLDHNSLSSLWSLMKSQLRITFLPSGPDFPLLPSLPPSSSQDTPSTLLSPLLTATYVSSSSAEAVKYLASKSFFFDPASLSTYLADGMRWWRGDRSARGVQLVDAWKCRICDFRDECTWREEKEEEMAQHRRVKRESLMASNRESDRSSHV
jgi:exonuclease V